MERSAVSGSRLGTYTGDGQSRRGGSQNYTGNNQGELNTWHYYVGRKIVECTEA